MVILGSLKGKVGVGTFFCALRMVPAPSPVSGPVGRQEWVEDRAVEIMPD